MPFAEFAFGSTIYIGSLSRLDASVKKQRLASIKRIESSDKVDDEKRRELLAYLIQEGDFEFLKTFMS